MDPEQIRSKKQEIIARYGPCTAHSFRLAEGVDTFDQPHWGTRLRRFIQIAFDLSGKPIKTFVSSTSLASKVITASSSPSKALGWSPPKGARQTSRSRDSPRRLSDSTSSNW